MNYQYSYLLGTVVLLIIWIRLYLLKNTDKKQMLLMSILFAPAGFIGEFIYTRDWWNPATITGTVAGIEDLLFGFAIAGIASVIYEVVFKKNIVKRTDKIPIKKIIVTIAILSAIFLASVYIVKLHTFIAAMITLLCPIIYIYIKRKDLIKNSMFSGLLLILFSILFYVIVELITPGWIAATWSGTISGITWFGIPIEDLIWIFFTGALIGPLYEFWKNKKLR